MDVNHVRVRKTRWKLTILVSILAGLFCVSAITGIIFELMIFGAHPIQIPDYMVAGGTIQEWQQIQIIYLWITFSVLFAVFAYDTDEFTYEAIVHRRRAWAQ
jgi:hypothetical protein